MFEKYGPIPLTRAIIREKMRYLGHDFWMNDDRYGGLEKWDGGGLGVATLASSGLVM